MTPADSTDAHPSASAEPLSEGLPRRVGTVDLEAAVERPRRTSDGGELPTRYEARDRDAGRVLVCKEAPGIAVRIDRSFSFSEPEARKLPARTILLDGAGVFGPTVDDAAHLYNLDHHEGCARAFTLASCEQAMVLVLKGLELGRDDWTIYANEPDLDTVFAIWVLLNHRRLRDLDDAQRDRIAPLLRLEGAIDANGFELAEWCGLSTDELKTHRARLDRLHRLELETKRSGQWADGDLLAYTLDMLVEIDHMVYTSGDFQDFEGVEEEYGHVDIGQGKVAVVCRDSGGIYDVERRLKKVWDDRLGIVALEREPRQYTLRRSASLAGIALAEAYDKLNLLDPAVDGRPPSKRWGGSDEIGGSPRPDGTGLTPREIGKILKLTYKRVRATQHLQRIVAAALWSLVLALAGGVAVVSRRFFGGTSSSDHGGALELALAAGIMAVGALLLTRQLSRGWTWIYGWRFPAGRSWLFAVPLVLLAGAAGGAPVPAVPPGDREALAWAAGAVLVAAFGIELIFRGLAHGLLVLDSPVQSPGGRFFLSRPALTVAALSATLLTVCHWLWLPLPPWPLEGLEALGLVAFVSVVCGLALGVVRERSLSVWPCALALTLAGWLRLGLDLWLQHR
ncbi:MAG: CPBP family glutamic-type intramembrane protease [Acidobacteriota bacterium]